MPSLLLENSESANWGNEIKESSVMYLQIIFKINFINVFLVSFIILVIKHFRYWPEINSIQNNLSYQHVVSIPHEVHLQFTWFSKLY